ncbi:alpha-amylase [Sphingobacteriales bacterium CHB3]|nr:alpha-amylase [Sphingobacteriales bacterium CHB3]
MPSNSTPELRLKSTSHPVLYEVNARVFLNELSQQAGKKITLDIIPDSVLDEWSQLGFDAVWLMGAWTTGKLGIEIARSHEVLRPVYRRALPDYTDEDVAGSPYAVNAYTVARSLGGARALQEFRKKLAQRGIGLVLDFVANHTARDHAWVSGHPEYYINGNEGDEKEKPDLYFRTQTKKGEKVLAFGRDPYFPGWTDTAQLNPRHPEARSAMIDTLFRIAKTCDGVRCDMAMLLLNDVFRNTWGERSQPEQAAAPDSEFWADAIQTVKNTFPDFLFIAEAYWNLEWPLQQLGFNYTYDKTLYDRLLREGASSVNDHLKAEMAFQLRSVRFVENHDEERAAHVLPSEAWHYAAATVAATVPGMFLLHDGQMEGRKIKVPVQLKRRAVEEVSQPTKQFYTQLLSCLKSKVLRTGEWKLLTVRPAWHDNHSYHNVLAYSWLKGTEHRVIVVNYAPLNSQCYLDIGLNNMKGTVFEFRDLMSPAVFSRDRTGLQHKGMYFDLPGYGLHFFEVKVAR